MEDCFADEGVLVGCGTDAVRVDEEVDVYGWLDTGTFLDDLRFMLKVGVSVDALCERAVDSCCED